MTPFSKVGRFHPILLIVICDIYSVEMSGQAPQIGGIHRPCSTANVGATKNTIGKLLNNPRSIINVYLFFSHKLRVLT